MKPITSFRIRVLMPALLCFLTVPVMSEGRNGYVPVGGYEYVALGSQVLQSPGFGTILTGADSTFSGIYKYHSFSEQSPRGIPDAFHSIDVMYEAHRDSHQVIFNFISESDQPVYGGLATFQAAAIYTYQLLHTDELSISLGLGAALGDFGIDLQDGSPLPLLPVPFIRMEYNSEIINGEFSFVSGPNLSVRVFPEKRFQLSGLMSIDNFRDLRDLNFDAAFHYRFFAEDDSKNDFAGISAGIRNNHLSFTPGGSDKAFEIQYYSVFAELDLSILKISGGYSFGGSERIGQYLLPKTADGYFLGLQAMYQFNGPDS